MLNPGIGLIVLATLATAAAMIGYAPGLRAGAGQPRLRLARPAVYIGTASLLAAGALLWHSFLTHQFQYDYVFRYSSLDMPVKYIFSAFWGGQEGTFLLWAIFGGLLAVFLRFRARHYEAPVQFFYLGINLFILLMLLKRSPFVLLPTIPADGSGLNPLLQDPWMTIHPPVVFFGFASLGIPAAYAMAALVKEDWDNWVRRSIPWTTFGVLGLGVGLVMGGYWAYSILGWGGFWGWDPVENSSLVPWLFAIVLLHNQVIQLKRGNFRRANLMLALMPFLLLTYSTFLTRSGVLADFSVHSFTDLGINQFLVLFMILFGGGGVALYIWKFRRIPIDRSPKPAMSRENMIFFGSLSVAVLASVVLLGTSAPLFTRLWGSVANVQPDFYNRMAAPFAVILALLMGLSPHLIWKRVNAAGLLRRLRWPLLLTAAAVPFLYRGGVREPLYLLLAVSCAFAVISNLRVLWQVMRSNPRAAGAYLAHIGVGLCLIGILASTAYDTSATIAVTEGEEVHALGYGFVYNGTRVIENGRKTAYDVALRTKDAAYLLSPTMFYSDYNGGTMKKPAIRSFLDHDVYLAPISTLFEPIAQRTETVLVLEKGMPATAHHFELTLQDFTTESRHEEGHDHTMTEVSARIQIRTGDETFEVAPALRIHGNGRESLHVPIPGTAHLITLAGLNPDRGQAEVRILPQPVPLHKGETGSVAGFTVELNDFEVEIGHSGPKTAAVFANAVVSMGDFSYPVRPGIVKHGGSSDVDLAEAAIGRTGLNLVLRAVDSNAGLAHFLVAPAPRQILYAEVSIKPFIWFLWVGTVVCVLGLVVATAYRARLADRQVSRSKHPHNSVETPHKPDTLEAA